MTDTVDKIHDAVTAVQLTDTVPAAAGTAIYDVTSLLEMSGVPETFFELSAVDIDGDVISMSQFAGKLLLVVNVASC